MVDGESSALKRTVSDGSPTPAGSFTLGNGSATGSDGQRYTLLAELGSGATGKVFRVIDRELGREVAAKVMHGQVTPERTAGFLNEARTAATLEHPNIVPIYDVGTTSLGGTWFTMRRVEGETLEAALVRQRRGDVVPALADHSRRVAVTVQVGNALRAAHARGVLHRDVKPANIMLGAFGEVWLLDWGAASSGTGTPSGLVGTPLYMAPEQAGSREIGIPADVYALGGTLFELLTLRPPLRERAAAEFWPLKQSGVIDAPTQSERHAVPRQLLAICAKALEADPAACYPDVAAMLDDLARWQDGRPVGVCRETIDEWARRIWRLHARHISAVTALAVMLGLVVGGYYFEHRREVASWGPPVVDERFDDDGWQQRWQVLSGSAELRDGALVTTAPGVTLLFWPHRLEGPTAIEYEAEVLPGTQSCDLSFVWSRTYDPEKPAWERFGKLFKIQFGAWDGSYTAIINHEERHLVMSPIRPVVGQRHLVRAEIVDDTLVLWIDGVEVLRYRDRLPLVGGWFAFYGYYPGKAFHGMRVQALGLPRRLSPTAVGDAFAQRGLWSDAVEEYQRALGVLDGDEAQRCRYHLGLCHERAGDAAAADATWSGLVGSWAGRAELQRLERDWVALRREHLVERVEHLTAAADGALRQELSVFYTDVVRELLMNRDAGFSQRAEVWLAAQPRLFPGDFAAERSAATLLDALGRNAEILVAYPRDRTACANALLLLGRGEEISTRYPEQRGTFANALFEMGRWNEMSERCGVVREATEIAFQEARYQDIAPTEGNIWMPLGGLALIRQGQLEEALRRWPDHTYIADLVQMHRGEFAELLARDPRHWRALLVRGDVAQALATHDDAESRTCVALAALIAGDLASFAREAAIADQRQSISTYGRITLGLQVLLPAARELLGTSGALAAANRQVREHARWNFMQRPWYRAGLVLGEIDASAFAAQPYREFLASDVQVIAAITADIAGRRDEAQRGYAAWLALPSWQRATEAPSEADYFVRWRLAILSQP